MASFSKPWRCGDSSLPATVCRADSRGEQYQVLAYAYLVTRGDETSDNFVSRVQDNLQITDRRAGLVSFGPWYLSDEKYQECKNPKKNVQSTGHSQNQRGQVTQVFRKPW